MTNKEIFEVIIRDCENCKITKPLDSCVDFDTTIGEWYEEDIDEIKKDLEVLEILKEKIVNLDRIATSNTFKTYNFYCGNFEELKLTEEEFQKIKEWLERE